MSELKSYIAPTADGTGLAEYYLKSEADKVIADLKDKSRHYPMFIAMLEHDKLEILNDKRKIRHQKYKRCLAMAKKCHWNKLYWRDSTPAYSDQFKWENRAAKWEKRWLALAEKFKEAK